jgi:hypothetical protein
MELAATGVGVTAVCPGIIDTEITANDATSRRRSPQRRSRNCGRSIKAKGVAPDVVAGRSSKGCVASTRPRRAVREADVSPEAHFPQARTAPDVDRRPKERLHLTFARRFEPGAPVNDRLDPKLGQPATPPADDASIIARMSKTFAAQCTAFVGGMNPTATCAAIA